MSFGRTVKRLVLIAACSSIASFVSCQEGDAHDQSGLCVIDPFMPPPFLGFEYWSTVGIVLGVLACGLLHAAIMIARED
jgi:hypothetical protein